MGDKGEVGEDVAKLFKDKEEVDVLLIKHREMIVLLLLSTNEVVVMDLKWNMK